MAEPSSCGFIAKMLRFLSSPPFSAAPSLLGYPSPLTRCASSRLGVYLAGGLLLLGLFADAAKIKIDPMTHDVAPINQQNWDGKVNKFRDSQVFAVLFYKDDCAECKNLIDGPFNELAKKMKGMAGVFAVNCGENAKLCKDQKAEKFPTILIYPPLPRPSYEFEVKRTMLLGLVARQAVHMCGCTLSSCMSLVMCGIARCQEFVPEKVADRESEQLVRVGVARLACAA